MSFVQTNLSEWPIVHIVIGTPPADLREMDEFQDQFMAILQLARDGGEGVSAEKVSIVMNLNGILNSTIDQQLRAGKFIASVREFVETSIYCTALIIESSLVRTVLHIITTIQPLKSLNRSFEKTEDALAWARANRARQLAGLPPNYEDARVDETKDDSNAIAE
jgi:hypothetical protein